MTYHCCVRAFVVTAVLLLAGTTYGLIAAIDQQQPGRSTNQQPFAGVLDEHPAIGYAIRPTRDRVAALARALADQRTSLTFTEGSGYLPAVLSALGIPLDSQLLVFSKTGIQRELTSPQNPRAIYFDESVVVGFIPGAPVLELAAHDPEQGVVFYTVNQTPTSAPAIRRRTNCLSCHVSANTLEIPGMIHRSNTLSADGDVLPMLATHTVDHRTPITQRWGGWFVTGRYTRPPYDGTGHMGNVTVAIHPSSGPATTSNEVFVEWLNSDAQARGYASHDSDVAALMVFDHQMHAINLITRLQWETRVAIANGRTDFSQGTLQQFVSELVDYLLFVGEVPPPGKVTPRERFANWFTAIGPKDRRGRSLRDLDLDRRLSRYPCSYTIHSAAFDALPAEAKHAVYDGLWSVLSRPAAADDRYAHLSDADRRAIVEILRDTKTDLPDSWGRSSVTGTVPR